MAEILVLYESRYGQTQKIASFIAQELKTFGYDTQALSVGEAPENLNTEKYKAVIIGAPILLGKFPDKIHKYIRNNLEGLNAATTAFFAVCLGILEKSEVTQKDIAGIQAAFFKKTTWQPSQRAVFAGALKYTKYNWFVRFMMKRISAKAGGSVDTSRDHEYTDWNQVSNFAEEFSVRIKNGNTAKVDSLYADSV